MDQAKLMKELEKLDINPGDTLIVHSSFRRIGGRGWTPHDLIQVLLEHLGPAGTLVFPTMTWRSVTAANPVFLECDTPGHVGVMAEVFRTHFSETRSLHPTHSVASHGPRSEELTADHHLGVTPCWQESPYAKLSLTGGKALLIDVSTRYCTTLHVAEERVSNTEHFFQSSLEEYTCIDRRGVTFEVQIKRHRPFNRIFDRYESEFIKGGALRRVDDGSVTLTSVKLGRAVNQLQRFLEADVHALDP